MTKVLTRNAYRSTAHDETVHRVVTTPDLLVVCDLEGTLADLTPRGALPTEGALRVLSDLAALPRTLVAIIAHEGMPHLRTGGVEGIDERVMVIVRAAPPSVDDGIETSTPATPERKDLAIDSLLADCSPSLIFFAGDDESDEPVFAALGIDDIGCKIGGGITSANLRLRSPAELVAFLERVAQQRRSMSAVVL